MRQRSLGSLLLLWLATAGCGGAEGTATPVPFEPVSTVATVLVTPGSPQIETGASVTLGADVRDAKGAALAGRVVAWSSANPGVAAVSPTGTVTGVAPGTTSVSAVAEGKTGMATVTVVPVPVAAVQVGEVPAQLVVGRTAVLSASVRDRSGTALAGRRVTWASGAPGTLTVDTTGTVTGVTPGTATVTATSEGVSGTASVVVIAEGSGPPPAVNGVLPAVLAPGATATISGTGFDPVPVNNRVTVRGVAATVTSASATQLVVVVPCVSAGVVPIVVSANARAAATVTVPVAVPLRTIALGQAAVFGAADAGCNELAMTPGARYLVSVFSAATSAATLTDFELAGNTPAPGIVAERIGMRAPAAFAAAPRDPVADRRDRAHAEMLERNRRQFEESRRAPQRGSSAARAAVPVPEVGELRRLYFNFTGGCRDTNTVIQARAVHVGTRAVVWEDTTNLLRSTNDALLAGYYAQLGQLFDREQYDIVSRNFGDPLRRDALTDADGRLHMVFTQKLNGTGAAAYVQFCDQQPRSTFAASNFGEYFYGIVPTSLGSNLNSTSFSDGWFAFMGRTVVHEVKHIASGAARVANGSPVFEESWMEEGSARHAEELWVREHVHRTGWKSNRGYGSAADGGVFCDFHFENATCTANDASHRPGYGMRRHFNEIREKLLQPWNWSPYGEVSGQSGAVFYQTAWSLMRYASDRYATSDSAFFRRLTNATTNGLTNLTGATGVSNDQLLGGWSLAMFADDYPGLANPSPDISIATWNLRSIYAGLNADPTWQSRFPLPFPTVAAPVPPGSFTATLNGLRGGAHAYYEITATAAGAQLLALRAQSGGAPSPLLRIAIARVR